MVQISLFREGTNRRLSVSQEFVGGAAEVGYSSSKSLLVMWPVMLVGRRSHGGVDDWNNGVVAPLEGSFEDPSIGSTQNLISGSPNLSSMMVQIHISVRNTSAERLIG